MITKTYSYGISGLDAYPVTIETDTSKGLPSTIIVGLPDAAIKESKERVRLAIKNSGYKFPKGRKTINLSPADTKKEGPSFDLAIAIGLLSSSSQINIPHLHDFILLGELSLDGQIKPIQGALSIALAMIPSCYKGLILPQKNANEASLAKKVAIYPATSLAQAIEILSDPQSKTSFSIEGLEPIRNEQLSTLDFNDVQGQMYAKRGLEIAAAGGHNVLMIGPPGSGKSMLSKRLPSILPDMTFEESLESTKIYSTSGLVDSPQGIIRTRPFRSPHHTTSAAAIVGGGTIPKPGEVTLSHNGILFLDELPEFNRNIIESLRQPLEDKQVTISRAKKTLKFPSNFMLVCAMNPCPCGFYTDMRKECHCSSYQIQRYMTKISGPLLDRIDIHLEVNALTPEEITVTSPSECSSVIKQRTVAAREIQHKRFLSTSLFTNANMSNKEIKEYCKTTPEGEKLLKMAIDELGLSARAYYKTLKVARTIADLDKKETITSKHLSEAIQYRSLDRSRWW